MSDGTTGAPQQAVPELSSGKLLLSLAVVIATAAVFGLTYSLTAPLVAMSLTDQGVTETLIGINAAMHALGVLCIAPVLPRLASRYGSRRLIVVALIMTAVLLALFPAMPSFWLWFPLRFGLGIAAEILFVLTETWVSELSTDATRGRIMATYTAFLSLGFAGGPLILSFTGLDGALPFFVGSMVALLALIFISYRHIHAPVMQKTHNLNLLRYMRAAPIAMGTTGLNAGIETAGLSFLSLYAVRLGWSEQSGTHLITILMVGAIMLQLPIGWICDKMDRFRLMVILSIISIAGAFLWPFILQAGWIAYPALFLWGGVFVGIYTTMLAIIGTQFRGTDLVGIYAAMGLFWGAGALFGPTLAGISMDITSHGLPLFVGAACVVFLVFILFIGRYAKTMDEATK
ncbi:MFS transporter [Brucellaceae bacterium C25G]